MTCGEFEELSGAYALDAVTPAERLAAEAHLATCARCTRLFQETRGVVSLLPLSVPPRHYKGVSFRSFATKATVLLGSPHSPGATQASPPHSPGATQASPPHVHTSPAPTGNVPVGAGEAGMKGGDVPGHFATRFVLCHSKPKSILPKLGVGTR